MATTQSPLPSRYNKQISREPASTGRDGRWALRLFEQPLGRWLVWLRCVLGIAICGPTSVMQALRAYQAAQEMRALFENQALKPELLLQTRSDRARPAGSMVWRFSVHRISHMVVGLLVVAVMCVPDPSLVLHNTIQQIEQAVEPGLDIQAVRSAPVGQEHAMVEEQAPALALPETETIFVEYHWLIEGETLGDLSARYGVSVASLFWSNDFQGQRVLMAERELRIPRVSGIPYTIQPDDTLATIAARFQVPVDAITLFKPNRLTVGAILPVGREIFVPGGTLPYPLEVLTSFGSEQEIATMPAVMTGAVRDYETNLRTGPGRAYPRLALLDAGIRLIPVARHAEWVQVEAGDLGIGWIRNDMIALPETAFHALPETNDFPPPPPRWVWPAAGRLTSSFGWRRIPYRSFHNGIDIANRAGTPILAARAGRVIEAGWCSGFGYCVRIDHGEGMTSIYGHLLKRPRVAVGDQVEAGDHIGAMGSTYDRAGGGYSTGVHLHFTVKIGNKTVDPLLFLP